MKKLCGLSFDRHPQTTNLVETDLAAKQQSWSLLPATVVVSYILLYLRRW